MRYCMRGGVLTVEGGKSLMKLKSLFSSPEKRVLSMNDEPVAKTIIRSRAHKAANDADVRSHAYVLLDDLGIEIAVACPDYAEGDDPIVVGWPICRMPKVDHAWVDMGETTYLLHMFSSQNYQLMDKEGRIAVRIVHRGLTGGWNIDATDPFSPVFLCGLFAFCRYIEQENELLVV